MGLKGSSSDHGEHRAQGKNWVTAAEPSRPILSVVGFTSHDLQYSTSTRVFFRPSQPLKMVCRRWMGCLHQITSFFSVLLSAPLLLTNAAIRTYKAYVRVKRPDQTVFVYANPSDTVETIITRLLEMTKAPFAPNQIKLVHNGSVMEASHTLSQYTSVDGDTLQEIRCHGTFQLAFTFSYAVAHVLVF